MSGRTAISIVAASVVGLSIVMGLGNVIASVGDWRLDDVDAYWNAALRLRAGEPLYPSYGDVNAADVYRYAPWFAVAWIPLTFLPRELVEIGWSGLLISSSVALVAVTLTARTKAAVAFAMLVGGFLFVGAKFGNVHPLIVVALAFGVERRSGPVWIALAASLKATPLLYVLVYIVRGEWSKAALTVGLTILLVIPMIPLGIADYTVDPGWSHSLYAVSPYLFIAVALMSVAGAAWVAWRRPRYAWLAASIAVIMTLPRYFQYELTYLFVGALPVISAWSSWLGARGRRRSRPMLDTDQARA